MIEKIKQELVEQYPLTGDWPTVDELVQYAYELGQDSSEESQKKMAVFREQVRRNPRFNYDMTTFIERS